MIVQTRPISVIGVPRCVQSYELTVRRRPALTEKHLLLFRNDSHSTATDQTMAKQTAALEVAQPTSETTWPRENFS